VYLRAGTYNRTNILVLDASDKGETWMTYPGDPVDSAVLDGGDSTYTMIQVDADNITINGLTIQHFAYDGIKHDGQGSSVNIHNLTVSNCDIGFNTATSTWEAAGVVVNGVDGVVVKHNYLHDLQAFGVSLYEYQTSLVLDHVIVDSNVILRTGLGMNDEGAIYTEILNLFPATSIMITNNYIKDTGGDGLNDAHDIYLDLGTNHATVSGNVMGPLNPNSGFTTGAMLADGWSNHFTGNIIDLGSSGHMMTGVWWNETYRGFSVTDNTFTGNVVVSGFAGNQNTNVNGIGYSYYQNNSVASNYTIGNNVYYNYAGGQVRTDGSIVGDTSPIMEDPLVTGWNYAIDPNSPVFNSPVNFPRIIGGWGPPGIVIPQTGIVPSVPLGTPPPPTPLTATPIPPTTLANGSQGQTTDRMNVRTVTCPALSRTLYRGSRGADVTALQQFLMTQFTNFTGSYVTGYYGVNTEGAIKQWQHGHGVVSSGSPSTTGWGVVGAKTRAAIMAVCGH
jgi:hypothetical protein